MNQPEQTSEKTNLTYLWLSLIVVAGAALRFFRLGASSFWTDEAGVALAARAGSIPEMLQVVRSHVLAMPLDYLVVWLVGRISLQEAALRVPAAIWGSASLLLAYRLFRRFVPTVPALLGLLFLALSPLHIQYSQELRFYASLVFFYLLSTLLLFDALQEPTPRRWLFFALGTILGLFFHPYVMFALANGAAWLALGPQRGPYARSLRISFLFCVTACLLAFLLGYMTFSASNTFRIPLMVFEQSPLSAVASGLGWLPFYTPPLDWSWLWGLLCAVFEITGFIFVLRREPRSPLAGVLYSLALQFTGVLGADLLGHYFFAPRQLIMLLPGLYLFAGIGFYAFLTMLSHRLPKQVSRYAVAVGIVLVIAASLPALQLYWKDDKGDTRALSQALLAEWQPGATLLVTPAYDGFVYKYYLQYVYQRQDVTDRMYVADWEEIANPQNLAGQTFVIAPSTLTSQQVSQLQQLGFRENIHSAAQSRYAKTLWMRPGH